jgi:hypothetical protein
MRYFKTPINRKLYGQISAFIVPKPCGFSTPRTRMPAGIRGHALQRRDSGRHHLRLISVSLSDRSHGLRTRMTQIARIFTDPCVSALSAYLLRNKPQINADERRLIAPAYHLINNIQFFGDNYS